MIFALGSVVRKEFLQIRRDPLTLAVLLTVPVFLLAVFGYAISLDVDRIILAVDDGDKSPASRSLLESIQASGNFDAVYGSGNAAVYDKLLLSGRADATLVIPVDFGTTVTESSAPVLQLLVDGSNATAAATISAYAEAAVRSWYATAGGAGQIGLTHPATGGSPTPVSVIARVWFNPELDSSLFLVPGLIVFIMAITGVVSTAMSIVREKERGTMEQLAVAPLAPAALILGKTIPYGLLSLGDTAIILAAGRLFFGVVVRGSYPELLLVTVLFILGCLGLGLMISTIAATQQAAFLISVILTILPAFILSGFVFPIANMPLPVRIVTYLFPGRYYLSALRGIVVRGASIIHYWPEVVSMTIFAGITLTISTIRLARGFRS